MENKEEERLLDIDKIVRGKLGSKSKYVPKFVINWFKKHLHQDELNKFLYESRDKKGPEFLDACVEYLQMNLHIKSNIGGIVKDGLDDIPTNEDGHYYTIVCNHPLGGQDGVALGSVVCHHFGGNMVYLVRELLMNIKGLAPLCIPINKFGGQGRNFPAMVNAAFTSEKNVVMFPAGLCSRKQDDGSIRDEAWTKTFIVKSVEYKRDVIPVHFSGQLSDSFYNFARLTKKLGIKANLAQAFLVDELFKNFGKDYTITFGEPIPWQTFDKSKTPIEWAQWVKNKVYEL